MKDEAMNANSTAGRKPHPVNTYYGLRFHLLLGMWKSGKISLRKVWNAGLCFAAYAFRSRRSARYPFAINMDLGNECNANCRFCRTERGAIYNQNPREPEEPICKGKMPLDVAKDIVAQAADRLLLIILYVNGEPLLYRGLCEVIRAATDRGLASMIATNGLLLNEENIRNLLEARIDFIKVAISGFHQETYSKQVRFGQVEKVKEQVARLARMRREGGYNTLLLLDFMLYDYNAHELDDVRRFCAEHSLLLNIRRGNPKGVEGGVAPAADAEPLPSVPCDFLWKMMTINWNGDLFPCCDCVVWSGVKPFSRYQAGVTNLAEIWNGPEYKAWRVAHRTKGRASIPICSKCSRIGTAFKY